MNAMFLCVVDSSIAREMLSFPCPHCSVVGVVSCSVEERGPRQLIRHWKTTFPQSICSQICLGLRTQEHPQSLDGQLVL